MPTPVISRGLPVCMPPYQSSSFPYPLAPESGTSTAPLPWSLQGPASCIRRKAAELRKQPHPPAGAGQNSNRNTAHLQPPPLAAARGAPSSHLREPFTPPQKLRTDCNCPSAPGSGHTRLGHLDCGFRASTPQTWAGEPAAPGHNSYHHLRKAMRK